MRLFIFLGLTLIGFSVSAQEFLPSANLPDLSSFNVEEKTYDIGIHYTPKKQVLEKQSETPSLNLDTRLTEAEMVVDQLWGHLNASLQTEDPATLYWEIWKEQYLLRKKRNFFLLQNQNSSLTLGE